MKHAFITFVLWCSATAAFAQPRAVYQQTQYKGQEIGKLTGDVYYARMDDYLSVFMVTPEGIVLVEPIGTEFATWLKAELASRFKVPVKYVIYSHHHWDHGSGASVYADTARIIGHEAMTKRLAMPPADTPLPQNVRAQDVNGNGRIEESEAQGNIKAQFALYDANRDRTLSGAEVTRGPLAFVVALLDVIPSLMADLDDDVRNVLLTVARVWFTIETGTIASKDVAADWVISRLPPGRGDAGGTRRRRVKRPVVQPRWSACSVVAEPRNRVLRCDRRHGPAR